MGLKCQSLPQTTVEFLSRCKDREDSNYLASDLPLGDSPVVSVCKDRQATETPRRYRYHKSLYDVHVSLHRLRHATPLLPCETTSSPSSRPLRRFGSRLLLLPQASSVIRAKLVGLDSLKLLFPTTVYPWHGK